MPRPDIDLVAQLISDLTGYVKDSGNNDVDVRARWLVAQVKAPLVTVEKVGEWCRVLSVDGYTKEVWAEYAIDVWAGNHQDLSAMKESLTSRLLELRKAYQSHGITYLVDEASRFIPEPEFVPLIIREQVVIRAFWFEQ
jgi:protoporphyrinogen oxidase